MKIYKDKQYLIFDFEDGRSIKYDFATKQTIGFSGKIVKNLNYQLSGFTIEQLINSCIDKNYAKFLNYIYEANRRCSNMGAILNKIPKYSNLEQLFSAGFEVKDARDININISNIPKSLIKAAKEHKIELSHNLVESWRENPDAHYIAYNLDFLSLNDNDIINIFTLIRYSYDSLNMSYFNILIKEFKYNPKSLLLYIDKLKTLEAIESMTFLIREIYDYAYMMNQISDKYDKYPKHFLTTFQIACRNYKRLKKEFSEKLFIKRINLDYECDYKDYVFIYPKCVQDIRDEAVNQNNCVASYVDAVIEGKCHILFLRKKDNRDKSLVTIEVRNNMIVQARRRFNDDVTPEDQEAIDYWNKKFENKEKDIKKERNVA